MNSSATSAGGALRVPDASLPASHGELPAGLVRLAVNSPSPEQMKILPRKKDAATPKADTRGWFPIPDHYASFEHSGLMMTIRSGQNVFDLDLK